VDARIYQTEVTRTMRKDVPQKEAYANYALGLAGEAGEAVELIKKHIFHGNFLDREKLTKELGDVLWYVGALAEEAHISLGVVMEENVRKLRARYPDGFTKADAQARVDVVVGTDRPLFPEHDAARPLTDEEALEQGR
jgi:NTP pyrophosphatase (non-canonical NTP hydrolase)